MKHNGHALIGQKQVISGKTKILRYKVPFTTFYPVSHQYFNPIAFRMSITPAELLEYRLSVLRALLNRDEIFHTIETPIREVPDVSWIL